VTEASAYTVGQDVEAYVFGQWKPGKVVHVGHRRVTVEVFLRAGVRPRRRFTLQPPRVRAWVIRPEGS